MKKLQPPRIAIVTCCTSRKSARVGHVQMDPDHLTGSLQALAEHWAGTVHAAATRMPSQHLYQGRTISEARATAEYVHGDLFIVSAGLGLVSGDALIPGYQLTISEGAGSIQPMLSRFGAPPSAWWAACTSALGRAEPIAELLRSTAYDEIWLAATSTYLTMLSSEMAILPSCQANLKLRIFTSPKGALGVPSSLVDCSMPYDARLEATAYSGTLNDFPQRSMRHFAEIANGAGKNLKEACALVRSSLEGLSEPHRPKREKLADAQVTQLLRNQWGRYGGSSTRLLRYLRDEAQVACEQRRFRILWSNLKQELSKEGR